jgi:hypothetical protein
MSASSARKKSRTEASKGGSKGDSKGDSDGDSIDSNGRLRAWAALSASHSGSRVAPARVARLTPSGPPGTTMSCPTRIQVPGSEGHRRRAWAGSTEQHSTAQHSTTQHSTARHGTARHGTAQHSTARHSTAQHNTAQHSRCLRHHQWWGGMCLSCGEERGGARGCVCCRARALPPPRQARFAGNRRSWSRQSDEHSATSAATAPVGGEGPLPTFLLDRLGILNCDCKLFMKTPPQTAA